MVNLYLLYTARWSHSSPRRSLQGNFTRERVQRLGHLRLSLHWSDCRGTPEEWHYPNFRRRGQSQANLWCKHVYNNCDDHYPPYMWYIRYYVLTTFTFPFVWRVLCWRPLPSLFWSPLPTPFVSMQELVNELGSNGAFSGTLAADSSNVVTLVEDLYNVSKKKYHSSCVK